jgi:tetratricopeptide (TPR) repeat protein
MASIGCPDVSDLIAFHRGDLTDLELDRVGDHLEGCAWCSELLAAIEQDHPVLAVLRDPAASPETLYEGQADRAWAPALPGYEVLGELGSGGMGVVQKARHLRLGRLVALKRLKADSIDDRDRFRREAETIAALQHVNIVQIHDVGEHRGDPYLALEYVSGGSLDVRVQGKPQDPRESAALVEALARAMQHAHERGVIHRDLKPANILLHADGHPTPGAAPSRLGACTPKVGDFGIAKRLDLGPGGPTRTGAVLGTPSYMAPEQATAGRVGPAADIYALGATLYELLTGRPPFQGGGTVETLRQVVEDDPVLPSRLRPGLPRDLETITLACLRKDPARRYPSAAALGDDLRRHLDGHPVKARRASAPEVAWKWARRHPGAAARAVVAQVALVLLLAGSAWYNARLRDALASTRSAESQAEANARLALEAHEQLVRKVQELLKDSPATRPLRQGLLETATDGLRRVTAQPGSAPRLSRAVAHELLGEIHWQLGRAPEAVAELVKGRTLAAEVLAAQPRNADARDDLARLCRRLGAMHLARDEPETARVLFREAVDLAESWRVHDPTGTRARLAMIEGLNDLGHAALWVRDRPAAVAVLQRAMGLAQDWAQSEPESRRARELLATSLDLLGGQAQARGDLAAARDAFEQGLRLSRALLPDDTDPDTARRNLLVSENNFADVCFQLGDIEAAREHVNAALEMARARLDDDRHDVQRELDLVDVLYGRGGVDDSVLRPETALPFYREARDRLDRLRESGKLSDRPQYAEERTDMVKARLAYCERLPRVLDDLETA